MPVLHAGEPRPTPEPVNTAPRVRNGTRRALAAIAPALLLLGGCDGRSGGNPTPINTDKCFTVLVPGPVDGNGNVTPPGSTVPLDFCEVK